MMKIRAGRLAKAWEHATLRTWLRRRYPDFCHKKPEAEIEAFLADRADRAGSLGFSHARHLQYLIDYELNSGLAVLDPGAASIAPEVHRVIAQTDVDPDERIAAAERLIFGEVAK